MKKYKGYLVSDKGQVFSKMTGKEMKWQVYKRNVGVEACVFLSENNKKKKYRVHRLVAMLYLGDVKNKQVNHLDGNTLNNNVDNLEICNNTDNAAHRDFYNSMTKEHSR